MTIFTSLFNSDLTTFDVLLYCYYVKVCNEYGYCRVSNDTIAKIFNVDRTTVSKSKKHLLKEDLISVEPTRMGPNRGPDEVTLDFNTVMELVKFESYVEDLEKADLAKFETKAEKYNKENK